MITSVSNQKVKDVVALRTKASLRKKEKAFLAEGLRLVQEIPRELLVQIYATEQLFEKGVEIAGENHVELVSQEVFAKMADTQTPQGILAIAKMPAYKMDDLLCKENPLLLILENLQDPGNLGTIFRTAEGAGVQGILMTKDCVDLFNPKVVRATMGTIFRMPFLQVDDLQKTTGLLREKGIKSYAAFLGGMRCYDEPNYKEGCAFLIGNEGNGLLPETADSADEKILIPMGGELESLNASVAAAILMYEAARQRRI